VLDPGVLYQGKGFATFDPANDVPKPARTTQTLRVLVHETCTRYTYSTSTYNDSVDALYTCTRTYSTVVGLLSLSSPDSSLVDVRQTYSASTVVVPYDEQTLLNRGGPISPSPLCSEQWKAFYVWFPYPSDSRLRVCADGHAVAHVWFPSTILPVVGMVRRGGCVEASESGPILPSPLPLSTARYPNSTSVCGMGRDGGWVNSLRGYGPLTLDQTSRLDIGEAWWAYTSEVERWSRFLKDCEIPFKGFFRSICTAAELAKLRDASRKVRINPGCHG
jgi:hypothetical protein